MTLKSVKEDLQARTLRAVAGLLGKLSYFAGLRQDDGTYSHWGLSRVYGEEASQRALTEAHRTVLSTILRAPLSKLLEDVGKSCQSRQVTGTEFLGELSNQQPRLLPPAPGAGSRRHLSSVLLALSALVKNRR
jgi:hypothetical protein